MTLQQSTDAYPCRVCPGTSRYRSTVLDMRWFACEACGTTAPEVGLDVPLYDRAVLRSA